MGFCTQLYPGVTSLKDWIERIEDEYPWQLSNSTGHGPSLTCKLHSSERRIRLRFLATSGSNRREHSVRSGCVIHKKRSLRADVVLFALVQRVGRPGTFCPVLIAMSHASPRFSLAFSSEFPAR